MKFTPLILPVLLAAAMSAQTTAPANTPEHHRNPQMMMQKLTSDLNLTADQQAKARAIFDQSRQQRKALAPKLREERGAVLNAIKTDNTRQIDRVIQENSQINAQAREIHAKAMAKFYAMLTPDQKAKMDQKMSHSMGGSMGPRHHAGQSAGGL
jgi:protein CpxP